MFDGLDEGRGGEAHAREAEAAHGLAHNGREVVYRDRVRGDGGSSIGSGGPILGEVLVDEEAAVAEGVFILVRPVVIPPGVGARGCGRGVVVQRSNRAAIRGRVDHVLRGSAFPAVVFEGAAAAEILLVQAVVQRGGEGIDDGGGAARGAHDECGAGRDLGGDGRGIVEEDQGGDGAGIGTRHVRHRAAAEDKAIRIAQLRLAGGERTADLVDGRAVVIEKGVRGNGARLAAIEDGDVPVRVDCEPHGVHAVRRWGPGLGHGKDDGRGGFGAAIGLRHEGLRREAGRGVGRRRGPGRSR